MLLNQKPIYLASPYTHESEDVKQQRFEAVAKVLHALSEEGFLIFSPIVHTVPLQGLVEGVGTTWDYWKVIDEAWVKACQALWVLTLDDWQQSVGVQAEIKIACDNQIPVRYVNPTTYKVTCHP